MRQDTLHTTADPLALVWITKDKIKHNSKSFPSVFIALACAGWNWRRGLWVAPSKTVLRK